MSRLTLAVMLAAAACAAALLWWWLQPTRLTIALEGPEARATDILNRFAALSTRETNNVRLTVVEVPDSAERLRRLENDTVDAAVFRVDESLPANGAAAALIRGDVVLIAARPAARVAKIPDLRQKRVGSVADHPNDPAFLQRIVQSYGIEVQWVPFADDTALREALLQGRVDAVALIARPDGPRARALFTGTGTGMGSNGAPVFLPVEASVVKGVLPHAEERNIAASVVDPRRSLPAEEVASIGVDRILLASRKRSNAQIASLTRLLFERRDQLAQRYPGVAALAPPSTDRGASLPVHPGAAEYIDANEMNFFTRYSDIIWIALCFTGVFGSMWGAIYTRYRFSTEYGLTAVLTTIATAGQKSRTAASLQDLCALEREVTEVVLAAAQDPRLASDQDAISLMKFTFRVTRAAIKARRRELQEAGQGRRALRLVHRPSRAAPAEEA